MSPTEQSTEGTSMRDALTAIMRAADKAKEPCGMDPESPAAIRNAKFATIAHMAAQGLGLVQGPPLSTPVPALPAGQEPVAWQVWWGIGQMQPCWPPYRNHTDAVEAAKLIKSNTEVRPLYTVPPSPTVQPEEPELPNDIPGVRAAGIMIPPLAGPKAQVQAGGVCPECDGTGEVFSHATDCTNEHCALNGDQWSCTGQVHPCAVCAPSPSAREPAEPVGEIVLFNGDLKEVSWKNGKLPPVGTTLYASPLQGAVPLADAIKHLAHCWGHMRWCRETSDAIEAVIEAAGIETDRHGIPKDPNNV
jgi:hypothetical protein